MKIVAPHISPTDFMPPATPSLPRRLLWSLKLVDPRDGAISLTNLALWVAIAKLALIINPGMAELGTLLLALVAYGYKKQLTAKAIAGEATKGADAGAAKTVKVLEAKVTEWEGKLEALVGSLKLGGMTKR